MSSLGSFCGWDTAPNPSVDSDFRRRALQQQPALKGMIDDTVTKCGLRPFVNDGLVMVGHFGIFPKIKFPYFGTISVLIIYS